MKSPGSLLICVFCGASSGDSPIYDEAGYNLGRNLGIRGHSLLYGAGGVGVMGAVARGAADEGANIIGIIPTFLREREMLHSIPRQEILLTKSLAQRKSLILSHADAFVALPGGYGTLDETLEVISTSILGVDRKPVVLVNIDGFWDPFIKLVDELEGRGFVPAERFFTIVDDPDEAIQYVESALGLSGLMMGTSP